MAKYAKRILEFLQEEDRLLQRKEKVNDMLYDSQRGYRLSWPGFGGLSMGYVPDSNPVYSITHNFIAKVVTSVNKAIVDEIKEWARIKGNTTVVEMDEECLMKIIELGSRELERLENMNKNTEICCRNCVHSDFSDARDNTNCMCPTCFGYSNFMVID